MTHFIESLPKERETLIGEASERLNILPVIVEESTIGFVGRWDGYSQCLDIAVRLFSKVARHYPRYSRPFNVSPKILICLCRPKALVFLKIKSKA